MKHCFRALLALAILCCSTHVWATASEEVIYTFTGGSDGGNPYAGPIMDANGNLYGTAVYGGEYGYGVVFEVSPGPNGQWTETVLHSFNLNGKDGIRPYSSLVMDTAGNLYGTTYIGGTHGEGTVFEVSPHASGRWTERILHNFNANGKDGYNPYSNLIIDSHGNLFGTTYSGGTDGNGTVFELTPGAKNTWQETLVHDFVYTDGAEPMGGVVPDKKGNLYGTTSYGGDFELGTVFELALQTDGTWKETVLHSFNPSTGDGLNPYCGLAIYSGHLYGATLYGGPDEDGTVFEVQETKGQWQESVIHSFSLDNDGINPYGPLAIDSHGRLYGTTFESLVDGVGGAGIVFQLTNKGGGVWQETVLHQFVNPSDGGNPYSGVILDTAGTIYGTTYMGGDVPGTGVVFEIQP